LSIDNGDVETPNWPSLPGVFRQPLDELDERRRPAIPSQPIGYNDAREIFKLMTYVEPPEDWIGGMTEEKLYTIGGSFECPNCKATLDVNNLEERRNVSNVVGVIKGEAEPDRYVMVGNHRDAWGFGAVDPSSGTSAVMEVARILGGKAASKSNSWRPRRSIVFFSWGAEEFGLIGSKEFAEDYTHVIKDRGVAYVNLDNCATQAIPYILGSPSIGHKALEAVKAIPNPFDGPETSYYDWWVRYNQEEYGGEEPAFNMPSE